MLSLNGHIIHHPNWDFYEVIKGVGGTVNYTRATVQPGLSQADRHIVTLIKRDLERG